MRSIAALLIVLSTAACGAHVPAAAEPAAPATHRDPPTHVPPPDAAPTTGGLVGIAASGGEDQARELLVMLLLAIRDQDLDALTSLLAPEVFHGGSLLAGRSRTAIAGSRLAEQLLAHARVTQLRPDARIEDLIELGSIRVAPVATVLGDRAVAPLSPGDLVV
nr:hypothetical protein [Myxococcota bacterium]